MATDFTTTLAETFSVRIVRDLNNKDGWVARALTNDSSNGKICFLKNIDTLIQDLVPGQLWDASLVEEKPKFAIINLDHCVRQ